nr:hypothetical protein [Tanacetum cinerariifolium]
MQSSVTQQLPHRLNENIKLEMAKLTKTNLENQQEQEEQAAQSFTPYWNFSMIDDEELLQSREKFMKTIQTFLQKFSRYPFGVMPKLLELMLPRSLKKNIKCVNAAGEELSAAKHKLMLLVCCC